MCPYVLVGRGLGSNRPIGPYWDRGKDEEGGVMVEGWGPPRPVSVEVGQHHLPQTPRVLQHCPHHGPLCGS